jgi:hypothetical protein
MMFALVQNLARTLAQILSLVELFLCMRVLQGAMLHLISGKNNSCHTFKVSNNIAGIFEWFLLFIK